MRRLLIGLVITALLSALVTAVTATSALAGAGYQKPHVGECRNITMAHVYKRTNSTSPIDCAEAHTVQTFKVGKLRERLFKGPRRDLARAVWKKCDPAWEKAMGRTTKVRLQTAYRYALWTPTKAEQRRGARWFRCDILLLGGRYSLAPLTVTTAPFISNPIPDSQRLCLNPKYYYTTCERPHIQRTRAAVKLKNRPWPGKERVINMIAKKCRAAVPGTTTYFYPPSRAQWKAGLRWFRCYEKTTSRLAAPGIAGGQVGVLPDPGVHGDGRGSGGVDRTRGAELRD
jgi:Septum formation